MEREHSIKKYVILGIIIVIIGVILYFNLNKGNENYQIATYNKSLIDTGVKNILNSPDGYLLVSDYSEYDEILKKIESCDHYSGTNEKKFDEKIFDNNSLLIVECSVIGQPNLKTELLSFEENNTVANVKMSMESSGVTTGISGNVYFIPVSKNIESAEIKIEKKEDNNKFDLENLALSE